jgi:hypothetical protein
LDQQWKFGQAMSHPSLRTRVRRSQEVMNQSIKVFKGKKHSSLGVTIHDILTEGRVVWATAGVSGGQVA